MRRAGIVLLGLGAFLLVLGPLVRFQIGTALIAAKPNQYGVAKLEAKSAQYFSKGDLKVLTGDLDITVTTRGDVAAASGSRVVWDEFTAVRDVTNHKEDVSFSERRSAFDKYTGVGMNCCGVSIDKAPVTLEGQIYKFPFDVEKKAYKVFNSTTGKAFEAKYVGEDQVNGLPVYKFEQDIPETKLETVTAPASVFNMPDEGDVQLDRLYTGKNTLWIEPVTGSPVKQEQQRNEVLKSADGVERSKAFVATATMTAATVDSLVKAASDGKSQIGLIKTTIPLVLVVLGLLLIVGGVLMMRRRREG